MKKLFLAVLVLAGLVLWLWPERGPGRGRAADEPGEDGARPPAALAPVSELPTVAAAAPERAEREARPAQVAVPAGRPPGTPPARLETAPFHALVVDALSRAPIVAARARLAGGRGDPPLEATSDGAGRLRLDVSSRGWLPARLEAEGYGSRAFLVDQRHTSAEDALVLELLPAATLEVRVRGADGRGAPGALVTLVEPDRDELRGDGLGSLPGSRFESVSDAQGQALLSGLPAEVDLAWSVLAAGDRGGRAGHVALAPGERRRLEVVLGGGALVFGHVREVTGAPVAELGLALARADGGAPGEALTKTRTDAQGRFAFEGVPFERWRVELLQDERGFLLRGAAEVAVERPEVELELVVAPGLSIEGEVHGKAEELAELHWVSLSALDGTWLSSASLEGSRFRLGPLEAGEYLISAPGFHVGTEVVRVAAGTHDVRLEVLPAQAVRISLLGAEGDVEVRLCDVQRGFLSVHSEPAPEFELRLAPGAYTLLLSAPGDRLGFLAFEVGPPPLPEAYVVRLERAARCTFAHRASEGTRGLRLRVEGQPFLGPPWPEAMLPAGVARTLLVPPRPLQAQLLEGARVVAQEELVPAPGESRRVELVPR